MKKRANNNFNQFRDNTNKELRRQFIIGFLVIIFIIVFSFILMTNYISNILTSKETNNVLGSYSVINNGPTVSESISTEETLSGGCQTDLDCGAVIDSDGVFNKYEIFYKTCTKCDGIATGAFILPNPNVNVQLPVYKNGKCVAVSPGKICAHSQFEFYCLDSRYQGSDRIAFKCNGEKECKGEVVGFSSEDCDGFDNQFSCKYGGTCKENDFGADCIIGVKNKPELTKCLISVNRGTINGVCKSGKCVAITSVV